MCLQAQAAAVTTRPAVAFVEYSDYDYDFEISFAPYKVDFIQVWSGHADADDMACYHSCLRGADVVCGIHQPGL